MPELPRLNDSLLARTDFTSDDAWREVRDQVLRENENGFRAYLEPVSDPAFDGVPWQAVKAAVPANADGASVLFIADSTALTAPDHPVLAVDLPDDGKRPFRCIPAELRAVENDLNISNMDWAEFADEADEKRGVSRPPLIARRECRGLASAAQRQMRTGELVLIWTATHRVAGHTPGRRSIRP
jgi:hypothetical protein